MAITISYNNKNYPSNHIVYKLTNLIINNIGLLKVIANIYIVLEESDEKNSNVVTDENKKIVSKIIRKGIMAGWIDEEIGKQFMALWIKIKDEQLGYVLEQIVALSGPYNFFEDFDLSMDAKVDDTKLAKDFDVVFFNKMYSSNQKYGQSITIDGDSEFHECKKNVCNFIPCDPNKKLKTKIKEKLEFIKATYDLHSQGDFFIPTLFPEVESQREFLKQYDNGVFNFIRILDIFELIDLVECRIS